MLPSLVSKLTLCKCKILKNYRSGIVIPFPVAEMRSCDIIDTNNRLEDSIKVTQDTKTFPKAGKIRQTSNLFASELDSSVKIKDSDGYHEVPITVPMLIEEAARKYSNKPALAVKAGIDWKKITFEEYYHTIKSVAKALLKLGLQRYHSVCILGGNSPEWYCFNLAAIMAGGIACGIYQTNSAEACLHCLRTSRANIVVVENDKYLQKILQIKDQVEDLKVIIQYTGISEDPTVFSWEYVLKIGKEQPDDELKKTVDNLAANECCSVLFTSGTLGLPKAVMLSHDNIIFKAKMTMKKFSSLGLNSENEILLSFLPLSHIAAQSFELYRCLVSGACVYFADENALRNTIVENLKAVRPTQFLAVPRIWEKIKDHIDNYIKNSTTLSQQVCRISNDSFKRYKDDLLCEKIRKLVGLDQCRAPFSGAAVISTDMKRYFARFGIDLMELYGMTETCGLHFVVRNQYCPFFGEFGEPIPGTRTKMRHVEQNKCGEICIYGRHVFMGYLNEPEITKNSFDNEGFYCTGDVGQYDDEFGFKVTGRIKELIITAGGENIGPALIEVQIKNELPVISHAVVVGERKKFLSLLITLKCNRTKTGMFTEELAPETKNWCRSLGCNYNTVTEIVNHRPSQIYNAIQEGINRANSKAISSAQRVQKFTILTNDFSVDSGELSPTMKVVRFNVYEMYKSEIDAMYSA